MIKRILLLLPIFFPAFVCAESEYVSTKTVWDAEELVKIALENNSSVRAAKEQFQSALHQVTQAHTPNDPVLTYTGNQSPAGLGNYASETYGISEAIQFPGKSWLQGSNARRNAEIARLTFKASMRDVRAQTLASYYQTLLDSAAVSIGRENSNSFSQVLEVVKVAYASNQAAQSDLISAEISLINSSQAVRSSEVAEANDEASLDAALDRDPRSPISFAPGLDLKPLNAELNALVTKALEKRQEILEAIQTEKNSRTSLKLAWMALAPDFSISYTQNNYLIASAEPGPEPDNHRDNTLSVGINVPIFFWFKQKEDITSARHLLEASRQNLNSLEIQTKTSITQLYRSAQQAYKTALLNKNLLVPLAYQNFKDSLVAYQSKKVDFLTLSNALQGIYNARVNYLTAVNQFLAGRVALEQAIGEPIP